MCSDFSATCCQNCLVLICSSETRLFSRRLRFSHPLPPFGFSHPLPPFGDLSTLNSMEGWKVVEETKLISFPSILCFPSILLISLLGFGEKFKTFHSMVSRAAAQMCGSDDPDLDLPPSLFSILTSIPAFSQATLTPLPAYS